MQDIIVRQLSKFRIDRVNVSVSNGLVVSLQITFPYVEVNGKYDITGIIGDLFQIYGDGPFWYVAIQYLHEFTFLTYVALPGN